MEAKSVVLCICLLALCLRIAGATIFSSATPEFGDSSDYIKTAMAICAGDPYPNATELPFFRAPGLPAFLAVATFCHPEIELLSKLLLILSDLLGIIGIYLIAKLHDQSGRTSATAALLYSLSPLLIGQTLQIQTEAVFQTALIWAVYFAFKNNLVSGVFLGFAALTRPAALGLLPLSILALYLLKKSRKRTSILKFILGFILILSPWCYSNYLRTGKIILINDAFAYNFWRGSHPLMKEIYAASDRERLTNLSYKLEKELTPQAVSSGTDFKKAAIEEIRNEPLQALRLLAVKTWVFLRPWINTSSWSLSVIYVVGAWEIFLYFFFFLSLVKNTYGKRIAILTLAYLFNSVIISIPFQVTGRFRAPFYEWVMIIIAAPVILEALSSLRFRVKIPSAPQDIRSVKQEQNKI